MFVGYGTNGYRLWNPESRKIFMARDVVFTRQMYTSNHTKNAQADTFEVIHPADSSDTYQNLEVREIHQNVDILEFHENTVVQSKFVNDSDHLNIQEAKSLEDQSTIHDSLVPLQEQQQNNAHLLRDRRTLKRPVRYDDFVMDYSPEPSQEEGLLSQLCIQQEAMLSYQECITDKKWKTAISEEKIVLKKNQVWKLVDRSEATGKDIGVIHVSRDPQTGGGEWKFEITSDHVRGGGGDIQDHVI